MKFILKDVSSFIFCIRKHFFIVLLYLMLHIRNEINLYYINLYFGNYIISYHSLILGGYIATSSFSSYKTQREENQKCFLKSEQQLDALNQITNFLLKPSFENLENINQSLNSEI